MEGRGVMRYADGDIYEVTNNHHSHHCQEIVSFFQGKWRCGLREGMGEIVFRNGDYYRGHWTNDNMTDGFGKFTCETTNIAYHLSSAASSI